MTPNAPPLPPSQSGNPNLCISAECHLETETVISPTVVVGLPLTTLQHEALLIAVLVEDYAVIPHHRQGKGLDVTARAENRAWL